MPVVEHRRHVPLFEIAQTFDSLTERRLDGDDLHLGLVVLQVATRSHEGAARPETGDEVRDLGNVAQDLGAGRLVVRARIRIVGVLIQEAVLGMTGCHVDGPLHRTVRSLFARSENHLGTEHFEHLAPFDRDARGHEDLDRVTLHLGDGGQRDTGIARRRFENRLTRNETATLLGLVDHGLGNAILHRAERVLALELGDEAYVRVGRQPTHVDDRRVTDEIENVAGHDRFDGHVDRHHRTSLS